MSKDVEVVWKEIEDKAFASQSSFEEEMLTLYKTNPEKVKELLTRYSIEMANSSVARYWKLADELWGKYTNSF
jgi:dipeptidase